MTARLMALALWLALLALALLATQRPKPLAIEPTPAAMPTWIMAGPPQFCPAPLYFCRGPDCPKPRSKA